MATQKKTAKKTAAKKAGKKAGKKAAAKKPAPPLDPRAHLTLSPANMKTILADLDRALEKLTPPEEPHRGDLVEALIHITMSQGVQCGIGQDVIRRTLEGFVDRNEFRLTEAYEIEEMLADLPVPNLFDRCLDLRESIAEVYNDQNDVVLEMLREASVTDRGHFFARVPAIKNPVAIFLVNLVSLEEILFSDKSTVRIQQRVGLDPKSTTVQSFLSEIRKRVQPFGHLPLEIFGTGKGPHLEPSLCAACSVLRLVPDRKKA